MVDEVADSAHYRTRRVGGYPALASVRMAPKVLAVAVLYLVIGVLANALKLSGREVTYIVPLSSGTEVGLGVAFPQVKFPQGVPLLTQHPLVAVVNRLSVWSDR